MSRCIVRATYLEKSKVLYIFRTDGVVYALFGLVDFLSRIFLVVICGRVELLVRLAELFELFSFLWRKKIV
jgi:hypothetical protein